MENNTKTVEQLKELGSTLQEAMKISLQLGATTKTQTLRRMIEVIKFDLYKLGVTDVNF